MNARSRLAPPLLAALLLGAAPAAALETGDGKLSINAFGSAGYGRTDGNGYGPGREEGWYDNTSLGIALLSHVNDRLLVAGQIFFMAEEGAELDWAFAEWKVTDALKLRAGKAKLPFGNYSEILDVGTVRPFFNAPTSIYGPAHLVAEGYQGAGVTGFFRLGGDWSLSYDAYGGEMDTRTYHPFERLFDEVAVAELEESETRDFLGARLSLETPAGVTFRLSGYTGVEEAHEEGGKDLRHSAGAASVEYLGDALSARAEYALLSESPELVAQAAYVELAWKFRFGLQLAARVEGNWTELDDFTGSSPLLRHEEAAVGVNYWFSDDFVVKASYHLVDGNRFTFAPETEAAPQTTTQLYVVGAQFSF